MKQITIRLARLDEGEAVHQLALAGGLWEITNVDWSKFGGCWWVAEDNEGLVGCVQCLPGFPVGHVEFLFCHPRLTKKEKACLVRDLCETCVVFLKELGSQLVSFTIPDHFKSWIEIAKARNCVEWYHGSTFLTAKVKW
jgi:hypothetical protein